MMAALAGAAAIHAAASVAVNRNFFIDHSPFCRANPVAGRAESKELQSGYGLRHGAIIGGIPPKTMALEAGEW